MKYVVGILIVCGLFFAASAWASGERKQTELEDIADLFKDLELKAGKWQTTLRETVPKEEVYSILRNIEKLGNVSTVENEKFKKYVFKKVHKSTNHSETFIVLCPKAGKTAELIIVVEGEKWNSKTEKIYSKRLEALKTRFFTKAVKIFACLSTESGAIIESEIFLEKLKHKLNIQHILMQHEKIGESGSKKVIYGYIPLWPEKIMMGKHPMNIQAVLKKNKDTGANLTIGTPILIHEY